MNNIQKKPRNDDADDENNSAIASAPESSTKLWWDDLNTWSYSSINTARNKIQQYKLPEYITFIDLQV